MLYLVIFAICSAHANNALQKEQVAELSSREEQASHMVTAHGNLINVEGAPRRGNGLMRGDPWPPSSMRPDSESDEFKQTEQDLKDYATVIHESPMHAAAISAAQDYEDPDYASLNHQDAAAFEEQAPNATAVAPNATPVANTTTVTVLVDQDASGVATSIGVMLLGMVTFTMSLFYATHFPDSDVQHATWLTLSESISLFSAVLLFTCFKDLMVLQFGETGGHHEGIPDTKSMIISFLRLLIAFWGVQFLLMKYRKTDLPLKAWGSIGGNFVAFAAIDSYGMVQQFSPFRDNPANAFLGMCIAGFMVLCMCISSHIVRDWIMTYDDGIIKEHEKNWDEQCRSVENQFASICLGLLLSVVIRFSISGSLPAIWGSPKNKTQDQVNTLFGVSLGFAVPVFAMSLTVSALEGHRGSLPAIVRAAKVTQLILSMSMGWSLVFCGQWEFWSATHGSGVGLGDKMTARMIDALIFSYISFGFIIALDFIADKCGVARGGFNAVISSFVLGLGIAWQGAFSEAVNALGHRFEDRTTRAYMDILMTLILCAVVLPAWFMYMLPKALAGPQPLEGDKKKEGEGDKKKEGEGDNQEGNQGAEEGAEGAEAVEGEASGEQAAKGTKAAFCNACGSQFEEGAQFCQNCGGKRQVPEEPSPVSAAPTGNAGKAAAPKAGKGGDGKGGRGSKGNVPAAPQQDENAHWGQQESWEQHDDGWGGGNEGTGQGEASF